MDPFRNIKTITSPTATTNPAYTSQFSTSSVTRKVESFSFEPNRVEFTNSNRFQSSGLAQSNARINFDDSSLSRSGVYGSGGGDRSILYQSSVRIGKGIGLLPEDRLKIISKKFMDLYGMNDLINNSGVSRIQRQAYDKASSQFTPSEQSVKQLQKTLDANGDSRVTQQDIYMLCRRYLNCDKRPIAYTPIVEERLAVARRLFKQFDVEKKGYLTEKQVPNLLSETYKTLGKSFQATEEDIKSWMKLTDNDSDGHVYLPEYERSIIRALKKQGIKIYEQ